MHFTNLLRFNIVKLNKTTPWWLNYYHYHYFTTATTKKQATINDFTTKRLFPQLILKMIQ